jgi:hypothetical protein
MGGVQLDDLSELAVLRPIQTAAAARPPGDDAEDGPDAADTGCVTPTASSSRLMPMPRLDGGCGALDSTDAAAAACVTPAASPCLLRPATVCPPDNKRKRCCCARAFFPVPHDLSAVFVPRRSPPRAATAKKVRLHLVG